MAYQVPTDLIEHVQILLREEAGLQSYNPSDPSFPSLPSVDEIISGFASSPDSSRCNHCNGNLLRGSQSLICVYCGRQQKRDFPPDPLSLKSTIGFQWLADSLGLDGSEIIEVSDESKQIRGRNSVKDRISLSDIIGLEMKWPVESERFGFTDEDDLKKCGKGPLQLAGIDCTHPFSEEKSEHSSSSLAEQAMSNESSIESVDFDVRGSRRIEFSENRDLSAINVKTTEVKSVNSFSAWEADFQSASSVATIPNIRPTITENETEYGSRSFSDVSISERKHDVGSVLEHGEHVLEPNFQSEQEIPLGDNQWVSSGAVVSSSAKVSSCDNSSDVWNDFTGFTGSGDNYHQTSSMDAPKEGISFDAWSDFTSFGIPSDSHLANRGVKSAEGSSLNAGSVMNSAEETSLNVGDGMFGPWTDVSDLKCSEEFQQEVSGEIAVSNETAKQKDDVLLLQNTGTLLNMDKINHEYSNNVWDNFMDSTVVQHKDSNSVESAGGELHNEGDNAADDGWGNFMSLSSSRSENEINSSETHGDKKIIKNNDAFILSNDFSGPACIPESISVNEDVSQVWSDIGSPNIQVIQQKVLDQQPPDHKAIVEDDDSWSNFSSSHNAASIKFPNQTDAIASTTIAEDFSYQSWNDLSNSTFQLRQDHTIQMEVSENDTMKDDDVLNTRGGLQSNTFKNREARMPEVGGLSNDWSSSLTDSKGISDNQPKVGGDTTISVTKISENDDSFDAWSDFMSSTTTPGNQSHKKESLVDDKQDLIGNDPFDAWSSLMSSSSQSMNRNVTSTEHSSETSLLNSSRNHKNPGLSSTLQPVLFPDAASLGISSSKALDLSRGEDDNSKSGLDAEENRMAQHASRTTIDAETLISKMHDLSFMLENEVSVARNVE